MSADREVARLERQHLLDALNREIRWLAYEPDDRSEESRCEFFCECGDEDCHDHLSLLLPLFDEIKRNDVALLADGHPLSLARRARESAIDLHRSARGLQWSARALQAEARLAQRQARRLRGALVQVAIRLPTLDAACDLLRHLDEPAAIVQGDPGVEVTVEIGVQHVADALSHVRDWAQRRGLASVEVTVHGVTRTLDT